MSRIEPECCLLIFVTSGRICENVRRIIELDVILNIARLSVSVGSKRQESEDEQILKEISQ